MKFSKSTANAVVAIQNSITEGLRRGQAAADLGNSKRAANKPKVGLKEVQKTHAARFVPAPIGQHFFGSTSNHSKKLLPDSTNECVEHSC